MSVSAMGRVKAAVATANALRRWRPSSVLLIGIAGGFAAQGVRLGDILIAEQVVDFELQKVKKPAQSPRFQVHTSDARLLEAAHHLPSPTTVHKATRPDRRTPYCELRPCSYRRQGRSTKTVLGGNNQKLASSSWRRDGGRWRGGGVLRVRRAAKVPND